MALSVMKRENLELKKKDDLGVATHAIIPVLGVKEEDCCKWKAA